MVIASSPKSFETKPKDALNKTYSHRSVQLQQLVPISLEKEVNSELYFRSRVCFFTGISIQCIYTGCLHEIAWCLIAHIFESIR